MPRRELVPISFGGVGLNTTGRRAWLAFGDGAFATPRNRSVALERVGKFPSHVRVQPEGKVVPLNITIISKDSEGQFEEINKIFDPNLGLQTLVLRDADDNEKQISAVAQQVVLSEDHDKPLVVLLWVPDPHLEDTTVQTLSGEISVATPSPLQLTYHNIGSADALPILVATAQVQKLPAQGWDRVREVAYANRSEFPLTGPGSGTWMLDLTNGGWDTAILVSGGEMLASGDDIAVFVDEVRLPDEKVRLDGMNGASTKVWIDLADGPAVSADLFAAITAGAGSLTFADDNHGFEVGDYLVWVNDAAAVEQARVSSVSIGKAAISVVRGERNTTGGATAAGTTIFRSGHHIQIAWGFTAATTRPGDPEVPLINLNTSLNEEWHWTNAPPYWPDRNRRPGGWRRILYDGREDAPELRKNRLSAKTAMDDDGVAARFTDLEPTAAKPNFDAIEFNACCGIRAVLGGIEWDGAVGWPWSLQIIGRDLLGIDNLIFNRLGHESGLAHRPPKSYTNQQETPTDILAAVILRARNIIVTTSRPEDSPTEDLGLVAQVGHDLQKFLIDKETQVIGLVVRVENTVAGTAGLEVQVNEVGLAVIGVGGGPGARLMGPVTHLGLPIGLIEVCSFFANPSSFTTAQPVLSPGEYFFAMAATAGTGTVRVPRALGSIYAKGEHWEHDGTDFVRFADEDLWFAILSLLADNQEDTLGQERSGEECLVKNMDLLFDNVTPRTPICVPAAEEDAYYYDTSWVSLAGVGVDGVGRLSGTIALRYLKRSADALTNSITIDVGARTVTDDENGADIRAAIEVGTPADPWLVLFPLESRLDVIIGNGAQEEDQSVTFRSTWQA